jgi:ribosomal protein S18 acetylase RimI-like enzyme
MAVRRFRPDDLPEVVHIAETSLVEDYTGEFLLYLWQVNPDGFLVAVVNGRVAGFVIATRQSLENLRILMIAVDRTFRNRRIGSDLLRHLLLAFSEIRTVQLEVRTDNEGAIAFYRKHGFAIVDKIDHFYTDDSAAYLMRRQLR